MTGVTITILRGSNKSLPTGRAARALVSTLGSLLISCGAAAADNAAPAAVMRRLATEQYRNIVTDVFGASIRIGGGFEPDPRVEGLEALGRSRVSVTSSGLATYDGSAQLVAEQVTRPDRSLIPCKPVNARAPDNACATRFFTRVGTLLYRRPLTQEELALSLKAAAESAATLHDFYAGLRSSLAGMLSSVPFLFRIEETEPGPGGAYRLDSYSLASRLSFFLWNSAPDDTLLAAAQRGELRSESGISKQVERMLASRRLEDGVRGFFEDMLGFDSFATLEKDPAIYPKWTSRVASDAREQTLRTITYKLLREDADYRDLFTDGKTFLTPLLASIYQVPVASSGIIGLPAGWTPYDFPKGDLRAGLLAQPSFTALHSHPGKSSPTLRGKALRQIFLCQKVPDPPANVDFTQFNDPNQPAKTARQRLSAHANNPACSGCHKLVDPIGLALESFDSIGAMRTTENGERIDSSGQLNNTKFDDAAGLVQAVSRDPALTSCLVSRLTAYAVGSAADAGTRPWLSSLEKQFAQDGYRIPKLLSLIATSPQFAQAGKSDISAPAVTAVGNTPSDGGIAKVTQEH